MRLHFLPPPRRKAFTLLELLAVMAIMGILMVFAMVGWQGNNSAGKFNKALSEISGILEQGRAYAIAQNTYVWIVLYENAPANNGPQEVYAGSFASNDGTDPFNWPPAPVTVPFPPGIYGSTTFTQINRLYNFKGLHLESTLITKLPNPPGNPNFPATAPGARTTPAAPIAPVFKCTAQSDLGSITLSEASSVYWVIQFTPTGAARNSANPIDSIWLGMQPSFTKTSLDAHNIAGMKINGLTGLTTIYRQ